MDAPVRVLKRYVVDCSSTLDEGLSYSPVGAASVFSPVGVASNDSLEIATSLENDNNMGSSNSGSRHQLRGDWLMHAVVVVLDGSSFNVGSKNSDECVNICRRRQVGVIMLNVLGREMTKAMDLVAIALAGKSISTT